MSKKYYKRLCTCTNTSYASPIDVKYTLGKWTYAPKGTLLFVYTANENLENTNTYECVIERPRKAFKVRASVLFGNDITKYWQIVNKARSQKKNINKALIAAGFYIKMPENTVMCTAVKLIKRIY